jgi:TonB-dependent receptor
VSVNIKRPHGLRAHEELLRIARRTALAIGVAAFLSPSVHAQTAQDSAAAAPAAADTTVQAQDANAQAQSAAPSADPVAKSDMKAENLQTVVVTGQRAALKKAIDRKKNSDKISDSIVADDMGKLPDNSVTEALQRVPGVSIGHFPAGGDVDHFTAEGGNTLVRGLNQVQSTLNGRETFSANGGRALSFEDVTPELISGVDVYKSQSADLLEGGVGGTVDLRTHMPFDYKNATYALTGKYNYADLAHQARPEASGLFSDRWKTNIGEFGALFDVAYSDLYTRSQNLGVDPYFPQAAVGSLPETYVPGGVGWQQRDYDRKRLGLYSGLQWKPTSDLELHGTYFRSRYHSYQTAFQAFTGFGNGSAPDPSGTTQYNSSGALVYTSSLKTKPCSDPFLYGGANNETCTDSSSQYDPDLLITDTQVAWQTAITTDYSAGVKWNLTDDLTLKSDFQVVRSSQDYSQLDVFLWSYVPTMSVDLRGDLPQISFASAGYNPTDPAQAGCTYGGSDGAGCGYGWQATMDHIEHHSGQEEAWHTDLKYDLGETGFFRSVKGGIRLARRTELDDVSTYDYQGLGPTYYRYYQPPANGGAVQPGYNNYYVSYIAGNHQRVPPGSYTTLPTFNNFFGGAAQVPTQAWFVSPSLVAQYPGNVNQLHQQLGAPGDNTQPVAYNPYDLNAITEHVYSGYLMTVFADNTHFGVPMDGNIGVRVVSTDDQIAGAIQLPSDSNVILTPGSPAVTFPGGFLPRSADTSNLHVLPSLNFQFLLDPQTHLRFAFSQAMSRPTFSQLSPGTQVGASTDGSHNFVGFTAGFAGNPNLVPETANQFDMSLEWYGEKDSAAHIAVFYKDLHNYITTGVHQETLPIVYPDGSTVQSPVAVTEPFNAAKATIQGVEFGGQTYFSSLPGPFKGLGINANFTYLDSGSPDLIAIDMDGKPIHDLPLENLSKYNLNLIGMYDYGPWSARLAYNWRSQYLLTTTNNGTTGVSSNGSTYSYALPIFNRAYGQLDASVAYKFSEHVLFTVEGSNLTDAMTRTVMGVNGQQHGRNWFMADRRLAASVRLNF